jgi:hypothetical protein
VLFPKAYLEILIHSVQYVPCQPQQGVGVVSRACGSDERELNSSYVAMESRRSSESQSAPPYCGWPDRFSLSKGLRSGGAPHYATARPRFRRGGFHPIIDVAASDIGRLLARSFSQRSRKLSHETARLALTTATQRPPTATDSMHAGLG